MPRRSGSSKPSSKPRRSRSGGGRRPWLSNLTLLAVAVIGFFGLAELFLVAIDVAPLSADRDPYLGFSRSLRVFEDDPEAGVYRTSPAAFRLSFNQEEFLAVKPADGLRIFVLGGSSAHGFPWGGRLAFARLLETGLSRALPGRTVEVVNAAAMSYASHRLRIVIHEVLEHEPDAIIVYGGHNEFVESRFYREYLAGAETVSIPRRLVNEWRLYGALARLLEPLSRPVRSAVRSGEPTTGSLLGLDVDREAATETGEEEKRRVTGRFEQNLRAIVTAAMDRGVAVILCTVPSNVRDWEPNQSLFARDRAPRDRDAVLAAVRAARDRLALGDADAARTLMEEASRRAPEYALAHFLLGRAYEAAGEWDDAASAYARARDADAQPSRALSDINESTRRVAALTGALLVDIERLFERHAPHGLIGFDLTEDYVHPSITGHRLIAHELYGVFLEQGLAGPPRAADGSLFWEAIGEPPDPRAAGITDDPGMDPGRTAARLFNLAVVLQHQGADDRAIENYRRCLTLDPTYAAAAFNLGLLLDEHGDPAGAAKALSRAVSLRPDDVAALTALATALLEAGDAAGAMEAARRAVQAGPADPKAQNAHGMILMQQGRLAEAAEAFGRAVSLAPQHPIPRSNLGTAQLRLGRYPEAIVNFRASLAGRHDLREARNGLAEALAATGRRDEAAALWRESLARDPDDAQAREGLRKLGLRPEPAPR